jgi:hypothetical protein
LLIQKNQYRCQDGALVRAPNRNITAYRTISSLSVAAQSKCGGIGGFELTCRRNLIYYLEGKAIGDYGGGNWGPEVCVFDRNLYWNASGKPVLFANKGFSEWQAAGQDRTVYCRPN